MRAWTRGEKIGCFSLLFAGLTCVAVVASLPPVQALFRPDRPDRTAETGHADAYRAVLEEQRQLLREETQAVREELRRLHDERIEARRGRIAGLAEELETDGKREYDTLLLHNQCAHDIAVALYYRDLDEKWITRGWWMVKPGETVTTDAMTRNAIVYFYAENQAVGRTWDGAGQADALSLAIVDARFDHLEGERWVYDEPRTVSFRRRHTGDTWQDYVEEFECFVEAPTG
jgi:hypothetical protein